MRDSHKGEKCVLIANGPSLNKIRWDWQDNFDVVMGMNKIFLGLERYNITKMTHCAYTVLPSNRRRHSTCDLSTKFLRRIHALHCQ